MRRKTGIPKVDSATSAIIGSDEAGYGNWAGPLVVVAVCAPKDWDDPAVTDSKDLDDAERRAIKDRYWDLMNDTFIISPVLVEPEQIDRMGVGKALPWAHAEAVKNCFGRLSHWPLVVIDGSMVVQVDNCDVICVPKADFLVPEVGLASCIAKTLQVDAMRELDKLYPGYGFANHNGYGTEEHEKALAKLGPCPAHRTSYSPVAKALAEIERAAQPQEAWDLDDE